MTIGHILLTSALVNNRRRGTLSLSLSAKSEPNCRAACSMKRNARDAVGPTELCATRDCYLGRTPLAEPSVGVNYTRKNKNGSKTLTHLRRRGRCIVSNIDIRGRGTRQ